MFALQHAAHTLPSQLALPVASAIALAEANAKSSP